MMNSEARKRATGIPASNPTDPEPTGTLEGAPGADSEALRCQCGHEPMWHHETRGCGHYGFSEDGRCKCRLTSNDAVAAVVREHVTAALEEIERRIKARGDQAVAQSSDYFNEGARRGAWASAAQIVRGYRQEQGR